MQIENVMHILRGLLLCIGIFRIKKKIKQYGLEKSERTGPYELNIPLSQGRYLVAILSSLCFTNGRCLVCILGTNELMKEKFLQELDFRWYLKSAGVLP